MSLIELMVVLVVVGVVLYLVNSLIPMQPQIKTLLNVLVVVFLAIWLLQQMGVIGSMGRVRVSDERASDTGAMALVP